MPTTCFPIFSLWLLGICSGLQPLPSAPPPRAQASLTTRQYGPFFPTLSVQPCGPHPGQTQVFTLDATTRALKLADGRCLLRSASVPGGITAGACGGDAPTSWTLDACKVSGCTAGGNESFITSAVDGEVVGIPGATGPSVAMWTVDTPTGVCHNELFAWSEVDSTIRSLCLNKGGGPGVPPVCPQGPPIFNQCLTVTEPPPPPPPCTLTPRVACHVGVWDSPPSRTPSAGVVDSPLLGNGDLGAGLTSDGASPATAVFWLGKSDMWATNTAVGQPQQPALHSDTFYTAIGAGSVTLAPLLPPPTTQGLAAATGFSATQDLASASVTASLTVPTFNVSIVNAVIASEENTLLVRFRFSSTTPQAAQLFNVTVAQATSFHLPLSSGLYNYRPVPGPTQTSSVSSSFSSSSSSSSTWAVWAAKSGVAATHNSLLLMPCDTDTYIVAPSSNLWAVDAGTRRLRLANATAVPQCPTLITNATATTVAATAAAKGAAGAAGKAVGESVSISIDDCSGVGGVTDWRLVDAPAGAGGPSGALQLQSASAPSECAWPTPPGYHNSGGLITVGPCAEQTGVWWVWEEATGLLHSNSNSSSSSSSSALPPQCLTAVPPNVNVTIAVAATVFLASDLSPVALVGQGGGVGPTSATTTATATLSLLPDTDYLLVVAAPTNRDMEGSGNGGTAVDPLVGALAMLEKYEGAPEYATNVATAHALWWATYWNASEVRLGEGRQLLEGFYYGSQYLLGSTARAGKVPPGLWGVFNFLETCGWNGDMTLDYNIAANYYGACSSNHCDLILPYADTVGSEWHLDVSRRRARANWGAKGSAGGPGQTSQSMGCAYMDAPYENPHICPNTTTPGHYRGLEMTSHIGPFPGLYYYADLSLRMIAAMSAMPFVEYADYSGDVDFLTQRAYPLVEEVVDFYTSYVTPNGTRLDILQSCAQEICGGGPNGESNPHHDIAFLTAMIQALLRWSAALRVDSEKRAGWQSLLDHLAPLPTGTHGGSSGGGGGGGNASTVWLEADDTQSYFLSNAGAYSIVYYAALHPAQIVSLSSDATTLATAWATVEAVNAVNAYHPVNGLCMAWPPATRCAGSARAGGVLDSFEGALRATMHENFYPDVGGGGVEQFGATEAVNSALLQSQEGFLRFFPMWPPGESASFTNLRARGAFLVSASFFNGAVEAPITINAILTPSSSSGARNCSLLDPWAAAAGGVGEGGGEGGGAAPPLTWLPPVVKDAQGGAVPVSPDTAWPQLPVWWFTAAAGEVYTVSPHT